MFRHRRSTAAAVGGLDQVGYVALDATASRTTHGTYPRSNASRAVLRTQASVAMPQRIGRFPADQSATRPTITGTADAEP